MPVFARLATAIGITVIAATGACAAVFTPAEFSVTPNGAASYSLAIRVPPGTAGMEPKLSLTYSSQAGDGHLGVGWSLAGLSAISRCPQTQAQDGARGGVNFDAGDRFCLDGQRLVATSGSYGASGTRYGTEREMFSQITSFGVAGTGPAYFVAKTKAGLTLEYGNTADSRVEAQGQSTVRVWALNRIADSKGNYLTVTYTEDAANGDFYPSRIDYTGNSTNGQQPYNSVRFVYQARPAPVPLYQAGSLIRNAVQLAKIQTYASVSLVKEYRLTYGTGDTSQRPQITGLSECDAAGSCLLPQSFTWQPFGPAAFPAASLWYAGYGSSAGGWSNFNTYPRYLADVDGDGKADVVGFASDGAYVSISSGSAIGAASRWVAAFGTTQGWSDNNTYPRYVADVNGDGKADVVGFAGDGVYVSLSSGASFAAPVRWTTGFGTGAGYTNNDVAPRALADVNGDGLPDVVGFAPDGVYVALNTGTTFSAPTRWIAAYGVNAGGWSNNTTYPRYVVDVNGDAFADIVGFASGGVNVSLSTGTGFGAATVWTANFGTVAGYTDNNVNPRRLADVNGDALPDVVGFANNGVYVSLNTGRAFLSPAFWYAGYGVSAGGWSNDLTYPRYVADVNGDGKADVIGFASGGVMVSLSTGNAFATASTWNASFGTSAGYSDNNVNPRFLADIDGDGLADVVGFASPGVTVSRSNNHQFPDLLTSFANGLGATTTVTYKPLTDAATYVKDTTSAYPTVDLQIPMYVAASAVSANGVGGTNTSTYRYGGLKADANGRGLLGFRWLEATQVETNITSRSEFRQDWPYVGMPSLVRKTLPGAGNGGVLNSTTSTYGCEDFDATSGCQVAPGKRYFPYLSQAAEASWDLNGTAMPTVTTTQSVDCASTPTTCYGNVTQITVSTGDGYSKTTTNTYTNDPANWILGRLVRAVVTSSTP